MHIFLPRIHTTTGCFSSPVNYKQCFFIVLHMFDLASIFWIYQKWIVCTVAIINSYLCVQLIGTTTIMELKSGFIKHPQVVLFTNLLNVFVSNKRTVLTTNRFHIGMFEIGTNRPPAISCCRKSRRCSSPACRQSHGGTSVVRPTKQGFEWSLLWIWLWNFGLDHLEGKAEIYFSL